MGVHIGVPVDIPEWDEADGLSKLGINLDAMGGEQTSRFYGVVLLLDFLTSRSWPVLTAWQAWQSI